MKTRILLMALSLAFCLSCLGSVNAGSARTVDIFYNDWNMPLSGQLKNGTTYVPLRQFFSLLGGSWVTWDSAAHSASVHGNASATFYSGSNLAWFNGTRQQLTGASYISCGTLYVPLRGIASLLDCGIGFNSTLGRVTLTKGRNETVSDNTVDKDALYWLSRIIEAESGGEPYRGKLAVGNVILNRVKSRDFPNSIYGVIFDRKNGVQFTPVANGTIYNTPSAESIRAAKACLSGADAVGSCLYFFNPKTATKASWIIQNRSYCTSIGNHDFYF